MKLMIFGAQKIRIWAELITANIISIKRTQLFNEYGIRKAVYEVLDSLNYCPVKTPKNVSIKVNLCYYWHYSTGETTDPRVVSSVIDYIRERWNNKASIYIVESDATAVRMKHAFKMLGYEHLAAQKGVYLSNLSEDPSQSFTVSSGSRTFTFRIPQTISSSDIFISIPKPKYHIYLTGISCALKNQFGCNPVRRKIRYHRWLDEVIVALNKIMKPNIVLVDGIIVPSVYPRKFGLVLAGENPLTVDFVVAQIMGFDPLKIGHIKLAIKEKIGQVGNIFTIGEDINDLRKEFPKLPQPSKLSKVRRNLNFSLYNFYLKLVDDIPLY